MYSPIREIKNEMGRDRFFVFSRRLKREVKLYGKLQYDHWAMVETDLSVQDYCERPKKIVVSVAGEIIETIFDMWVKTSTNEEFIFVSNAHDINFNDNRSKQKKIKELLAQQIWCKEMKQNHRVVTEKDIRHNPILLANKKTLIPYFLPKNELNNELYQKITDTVRSQSMSIREIEKIPGFHAISVRNQIYAMIYHGILKFNHNHEFISSLTEVTLNDQKTHVGKVEY
ncbi:hypothetical protein [Paenibacillus sp. ISL-20]|uniref:hypothetical protein n=1 Tax=Paenibacillus sp. ISL-20 TaxID=2819163 RepID=UPI001BE91655|nr:hypothetical protein [Paenibacillus sp. ISL-20]MBT2765915.1 hypothetical protein [Paenibacillus sp. ISL-20]